MADQSKNRFVLLQSSRLPNGTFTGLNGQTIVGDANGAWAVTANGTNQSITLTPSGTGSVKANITTSGTGGIFVGPSSGIRGGIGYNDGTGVISIGATNSNGAVTFYANSLEKARLAPTTGNLLLGGLTTDGTGVLQFPAATTSAGGITFGTDFSIYRSGTKRVVLGATDTTTQINFIDSAAATSLVLQSAGTTALTLDSSQNATLVGNLTMTALKQVKFGATANATIGVSADTTAGVLTLTAPSSGSFFMSGGELALSANTQVAWGGTGAQTKIFGSSTSLSFYVSNTEYFTVNANLVTVRGGLAGTVQALSGAGAVNVTQLTTEYTSTGGAQALTLADGTAGQIKTIIHGVDGGSGVLTPTTKTGFTSITFTNAGDTATLQFLTTRGWTILAVNGATITP